MRNALTLGVAIVALAGCRPGLAPEAMRDYQSRMLFTCCNLHHEGDQISDANYYVGATIPLGTPAQVLGTGGHSVTFSADGTKIKLDHKYGADQEPFQHYLDKILVSEDPKARVANLPQAVREAIHDGRVERGMTREQVLLSLGYPPTHRTPSTTANEWLYWYNRWVTYRVAFNDAGTVENVIGRPAPTRDQPIEAEKRVIPPAKPAKRKH